LKIKEHEWLKGNKLLSRYDDNKFINFIHNKTLGKIVKMTIRDIMNVIENIENYNNDDFKKIVQEFDTDGNNYLDDKEYYQLTPLFISRIKELTKSEKIEDKILKKYLINISNFKNLANEGKLTAEDFVNFKKIKMKFKNEEVQGESMEKYSSSKDLKN